MTETSVEGSPLNSGGSDSNLSFGLLPSPWGCCPHHLAALGQCSALQVWPQLSQDLRNWFWQDFTQTCLVFETIFTEAAFSGVGRGRVPFWWGISDQKQVRFPPRSAPHLLGPVHYPAPWYDGRCQLSQLLGDIIPKHCISKQVSMFTWVSKVGLWHQVGLVRCWTLGRAGGPS